MYDNVITGYESPRYISFLNDGFLKFRIVIKFEKKTDNPDYPTRLVYSVYSRRRSLLFQVRSTILLLAI